MEFLVRTRDKLTPDDPRHLLFTRRGESIVACPDGHAWSEAERTNPDWLIVRRPDLSEAEAGALSAPLRAAPGSGEIPQLRAFYFDLDSDPPAVAARRPVLAGDPDTKVIG